MQRLIFTKVSIYAKQGNSYYISASGLTTEDYLIGASVEKSEDGTSETITTDPTNLHLIAVSAPAYWCVQCKQRILYFPPD